MKNKYTHLTNEIEGYYHSTPAKWPTYAIIIGLAIVALHFTGVFDWLLAAVA